MKFTCRVILLIFTVLLLSDKISAQNKDGKIDQIEAFKKYAGTWSGEMGNDIYMICENTPFGTGFVCSCKIIANGAVSDSFSQVYGYDPGTDKYIIATIRTGGPAIQITSTWFTTPTTGEVIITTPKDAPYKFTFEFKDPDTLVQTAYQNGSVVTIFTLHKEKKDKK